MLPQRIILAIMAFLGVAVCMAMRSCLSIALTEMVKPIEINQMKNDTAVCPAVKLFTENSDAIHNNDSNDNETTKYSWTQEQQGWILSSFFGGYLIGHIPGAVFPHKFSAKWMFSMSILIPSVFNAATPLFVKYGVCNINLLQRRNNIG